ncbi:MAG: SDR family oxidoreductase [Candidatus Latescibacteria bacterium]|nr:SDR family oxidoreductase [Candidatus Latescibacterota bacterium]
MRLTGKVAIVTGSGRGIGAGIAKMFAREGARVMLAARTESQLEEVARKITDDGGTVRTIPTDVSKPEDLRRMVKEAGSAFGRLDILVNNAGVTWFGKSVEEGTEELYDRLMDTNLKGMWMGCHYAVPEMKKAGGGAILNIASVHGVMGFNRQSAYAASKGGIIAGSRSLAVELAPFHIRVNVISPGAIRVREPVDWVVQRVGEQFRAEFLARFGDRMPNMRMVFQPLPIVGVPEDIAYCAVYLASDEARFVTGANFMVDGGLTAQMAQMKEADPEVKEKRRRLSEEIQAWIAEKEKERGRGGVEG